jgi:hypothetical protein
MPLPPADTEDLHDMLFAAGAEDTPRPVPPPPPPAPTITELMQSAAAVPTTPVPDLPAMDEAEQEAVRAEVLAEIAAEGARTPPAMLYQDYRTRCRMRGVTANESLDLFRRNFAMARAGMRPGEDWDDVLALSASLPEEMLAPFLGLARTARAEEPCPDDTTLADLYCTASPSRARRMLTHIEELGLIVVRVDLLGKRSVTFPHFGWTTLPAVPEPGKVQAVRRAGVSRRG